MCECLTQCLPVYYTIQLAKCCDEFANKKKKKITAVLLLMTTTGGGGENDSQKNPFRTIRLKMLLAHKDKRATIGSTAHPSCCFPQPNSQTTSRW